MRRLGLTVDWRDADADAPSSEEVSGYLVGRVISAAYLAGGDVLELVYEDGRTVRVRLHQCRAHSCDDTLMVLEETQDEDGA